MGAASEGLLLRGAGSAAFANVQPFDLGGPGDLVNVQPFDLEQAAIEVVSAQPFDLGQSVELVNTQPFDLLGAAEFVNAQPFDLLGTSATGQTISSDTATVGAYVDGVWHPGLLVFDVDGTYVGSTDEYNVSSARSKLINDAGSMSIAFPRDVAVLVAEDRFVVVGNDEGAPMFAGVAGRHVWSDSQMRVEIPDVFSMLSEVQVELSVDPGEETPAWQVLYQLMLQVNGFFSAHGQPEWELAAAGTLPYLGRAEVETDAWSAISDLAEKSGIEFSYTARVESGRLVLGLFVRDQMPATTGIAITEGSLAAQVNYVEDPVERVDEIIVRGAPSEIASFMPDWGRWAVHEVEPEARRLTGTPPVDRRWRQRLIFNVDWGLSKADQQALADQTYAQLKNMFTRFLYGFHQDFGRPFHEGWEWSGMPSDLEGILNTGNGWYTHSDLIELENGDAASIVMQTDADQQALVVRYNRYNGNQSVRRMWWDETGAVNLIKMEINGWARWFENDAGGVLTDMQKGYFDHKWAYVSGPVEMLWVHTDKDGKRVRDTIRVREVLRISDTVGHRLQEGNWFVMWDPYGPTNDGSQPYMRFSRVRVDEGPTDVAVTKTWPWERLRIHAWDPRRDGTGDRLIRRHVKRGAPDTRRRWHTTPWLIGQDAQTRLLQGLRVGTDTMIVESVVGFPEEYPFYVEIGIFPANEIVRVWRSTGANEWGIRRGRMGTTAKTHDVGSEVQIILDPEEQWDGFVFDYTWSRGERYADDLLAQLGVSFKRLSAPIVDLSGATLGSVHAVDIDTEGPPGGVHGSWRCIGLSIDEYNGVLEPLLEPVP